MSEGPRRSSMALALGMIAGLAAGPAMAETWLMASGYPEDNFHTQNIRLFIDEVEANSDLAIDLQSNDTLVRLDAIRAAVQRAQVPIGEIRLGVYGNENPMFLLESVPFITPDYTAAWLLKDFQREYFDELFAENGIRVLYYTAWPGQGFYLNNAVETVEDFAGKRLRIYSPATQQMGEMLGFQATILPFAEVPQAFSTGLIEALFTSPQTGIDVQAWDNTSHFVYAGAMFNKNAVIVNESAFQALPRETQDALLAAARRAELRGFEMSAATTAEQMRILEENGMDVSMAPASVVERMLEIGDVMMEEWRAEADEKSNEILDRYLALR